MSDDEAAGDITIRPENQRVQSTSRPRSQPSWTAPDDSATESESESVMVKFLGGRRPRTEQCPVTGENWAPALAAVDNSLGNITENSLVPESAPNSSPPRVQLDGNSSQWSSEDTQALYLAGAPLSVSDFSLRMIATDDSTQPMPPAVRDFMDMFDSDEGSYPSDFPMELRC